MAAAPCDDSKDRISLTDHSISPSKLKPGDHIYTYCGNIMFGLDKKQHHGIYIGKESYCRQMHVIHVVAPEDGNGSTCGSFSSSKGCFGSTSSNPSSSSSKGCSGSTSSNPSSSSSKGCSGSTSSNPSSSSCSSKCEMGGKQPVEACSKKNGGVEACTLDDFRNFDETNTLYLVAYDVSLTAKMLKTNGTSHVIKSDPPAQVIARAKEALKYPERHNWTGDDYALMSRNCETFAFWCKTGSTLNVAGQQNKIPVVGDVAEAVADGCKIS